MICKQRWVWDCISAFVQRPRTEWFMIWLAIGVVLSVIGVRLIYKNENSYVKVMNG